MKFITTRTLTILITLSLVFLSSCSNMESEIKSEVTQFNSKTSGNDWGNGSVYFLDRHNVDCGQNKIIQGFHLFRPRGNQIAYEFSCGGNASLVKSNSYSSQTPWNATDRNERHSTNYLDRHNVQCKQGYALQQFKLIRNNNRIAYQFRCAQLVKALQCNSNRTPSSYGNRRFENIYLDRQRISVGGDRALTQFKLNSQYKSGAVHYTYSFSSCKMGTIAVKRKKPAVKRPSPRRPILKKLVRKVKNILKKPRLPKKRSFKKRASNKKVISKRQPRKIIRKRAINLRKKNSKGVKKNSRPKRNLKFMKPKRNVRNSRPKRNPRYMRAIRNVRKFGPRKNVRKFGPRKNVRNLRPRRNIRNLRPRGNVRKSRARKNVRNLRPRGNVRKSRARRNVRNLRPRGNVRKSFSKNNSNAGLSARPFKIHKIAKRIDNYSKNFPVPVKNIVNKPNKFIPPALIKPKKVSSDRKQIIAEGNNFCKSFCAPDAESKEKKCWMNGIKSCFSCQAKDKETGKDKDADKLCSTVCNSIEKSNNCAFYSYINENKKIVNARLLSKYGLRTFRRYLKKLL